MKENYLEKALRDSWKSFILGHILKENHLEKLCGSWNPYPSAFYEGELPGEALQELKSLS